MFAHRIRISLDTRYLELELACTSWDSFIRFPFKLPSENPFKQSQTRTLSRCNVLTQMMLIFEDSVRVKCPF